MGLIVAHRGAYEINKVSHFQVLLQHLLPNIFSTLSPSLVPWVILITLFFSAAFLLLTLFLTLLKSRLLITFETLNKILFTNYSPIH